MDSFVITRVHGTQRDLRKANRRELVVIANSLEARFCELSRVYCKGFDLPKQHSSIRTGRKPKSL